MRNQNKCGRVVGLCTVFPSEILSSSLCSCSDRLLAVVPHFQTSPVTSAVCFYFQSEAQPKTRAARHWNGLYMEKCCKIISASKAESCVRCLNRFQHFFSSKPFIHQVSLWCSGHLLKSIKSADGVCLSVSVHVCVCQRERLRADFPHAAQLAHPLWYPHSTPTLQRLHRPLKKP